jgi:adenylate cyclase
MGLATGEAIVRTIGSATFQSFTVIGDTVNLAARLENANKIYGTRILVSDETRRLAGDQIECREIDLLAVAGRSEPARVHELLGPRGAVPGDLLALRDAFADGIAAYRARDWDAADARFAACLALRPDDGPSRLYLERIAAFRRAPPAADWDGVWRLTAK